MNIATYLKDIQKELRVTTFPTQNVVISFTLFVIIFTAAMAVYLGALDLVFGEAILKFIARYKTAGGNVNIPAVVATTTDIINKVASSTATTTVPANLFQ